MKQLAFERARRETWQAYAAMLEALERSTARRGTATDAMGTDATAFVEYYRELCRDLAVARSRGYAPALQAELNLLVSRGHVCLYARRAGSIATVVDFVTAAFPRRVRHDAGFVAAAGAAFLLPLVLVVVSVAVAPDVIYSTMPDAQVRELEAMYRPDAERLGRARASDSDFAMFGFYIWNNVSIGFQLFATGLALGIGTLFYLAYNGIVIGAVSAHLVGIGYGGTFLPFVAGHGAFELTAIVLCGAAGLKLGYALLAPGTLTRAAAVRRAGTEAVVLVVGSAAMLVLAAFVEAYWSSTSWPPATLKYTVGAALWLLVIGYFCFSGRRRAA